MPKLYGPASVFKVLGGEIMDIIYETTVSSSIGGRDGHVKSQDGLIDLDVRKPVEMGGEGKATNPEQLFAAGYSACYHSAVLSVAKSMHIDVPNSEVEATVGIGKNDGGEGFKIQVTLTVDLPEVPEGLAWQIMEKAHMVCPYSNATRGNVHVKLMLKPQTTQAP